MAKKSNVVVEQVPEAPVETKVLAQAIVDISEAMKKLSRSGLNRKAIVILVAKDANQYQATVERVMDALENLRKTYCTI